jgi:hypothetical protein
MLEDVGMLSDLSNLPAFARRHRFALAAAAIITTGVALRLTLIAIGWPHSDSEEGTMGLEAMHILLRGEHPVYLYGQSYMGASEAYVGALAFRLFGISTFTLRLGMIAFYTIFLASVGWLASVLYSRRVALVSLALLVLGTPFLVQIELLTDGGKVDVRAAGAMLFALAVWLGLSAGSAPPSGHRRWLRRLAFFAWGLIAGWGLYTYIIIAPFVFSSAVLLVILCRRELRGWLLTLPIAGLLIGLLPAIAYAASMPPADNPLAVFLSLHNSPVPAGFQHGWHLVVKQVEATLLFTLPEVTGLIPPFSIQAMPFFGPLRLASVAAVVIGGGWSLVYLSLLGVATYRPLFTLRKQWVLRRTRQFTGDAAGQGRDSARLLLALAGWLTIAGYAASPTAAVNPGSGRYMIGLLIVLPAVLWPLVDGIRFPWAKWKTLRLALPPVLLLLMGASQVAGAVAIVQVVPTVRGWNQQDARFAHDLLGRGITRIYSDYWTCDLLTFETHERLTCGVVTSYAQPGYIRYPSYYAAVQADPSAPYMFVQGSSLQETFLVHIAATHVQYSVQFLDGYAIYTPAPA